MLSWSSSSFVHVMSGSEERNGNSVKFRCRCSHRQCPHLRPAPRRPPAPAPAQRFAPRHKGVQRRRPSGRRLLFGNVLTLSSGGLASAPRQPHSPTTFETALTNSQRVVQRRIVAASDFTPGVAIPFRMMPAVSVIPAATHRGKSVLNRICVGT
jgi:hypothetical protein